MPAAGVQAANIPTAETSAADAQAAEAPAAGVQAGGYPTSQPQALGAFHPNKQERLVYLDNAATTPTAPEVIDVMNEVLREAWGNPSSPHVVGKRAKAVLDKSREVLANILEVEPQEIYFTSGSTESNNLAVRGCCLARRENPGQIVTSSLEHASVTRSVRGMRRDDQWPVAYVEAPEGQLDLEQLQGFLKGTPTTLITMMRVQNEVGWVFPIREVSALRDQLAPNAILHCDATQAFGKIPTTPAQLGCELMTAGAHKIGGPRGIGMLYVKRGIKLFTTAFGGGQEQGLRSGTEPVYLAAGMAKAAQLATAQLEQHMMHAESLRDYALTRLPQLIPDVNFRGICCNEEGVIQVGAAAGKGRFEGCPEMSPYILSVSVPGLPNAKSVKFLSEHGVCVSRASACEENHTTVAPGTWREKHPLSLQAAGIPLREGKETLRLSFWHTNTKDDVERFAQVLAQCANELRYR